jgi:DNA-binding TFAR19-related protein (PDSD5 family)
MDDSELQRLRQKRLAELQQSGGSPGGPSSNGAASQQQQEDMKRQQDDMKNSILAQVLTQEARARCNSHLVRSIQLCLSFGHSFLFILSLFCSIK